MAPRGSPSFPREHLLYDGSVRSLAVGYGISSRSKSPGLPCYSFRLPAPLDPHRTEYGRSPISAPTPTRTGGAALGRCHNGSPANVCAGRRSPRPPRVTSRLGMCVSASSARHSRVNASTLLKHTDRPPVDDHIVSEIQRLFLASAGCGDATRTQCLRLQLLPQPLLRSPRAIPVAQLRPHGRSRFS
jgi:hypothetical protein